MAYSPANGLFYTTGGAAPLWITRWPDPYVFSAVGSAPYIQNYGILAAIDAKTDKIVWQKKLPFDIQNGSGVAVTAGGLLFHGEPDGEMQAYDAANGDLLWHFQTGSNESGPPAIFEIDGDEYVAVVASDAVWAWKLGGKLAPVAPPPPPAAETTLKGRIESTDHVAMSGEFTDGRSLVRVLHYTDEYAFKPQRNKVKVGTKVTWTNDGKLPHDATALDGSWTTGDIAPGKSASIQFDKAGIYMYHCKEHPWSYGQVIVE